MNTYTRILKNIFQEKKTDKIIEDYDKNAMENILQENCVKTANEIIKIVIKAIDDYANKKETSTEMICVTYSLYRIVKFTFSENDSKILKNILTDKIPTKIIEKILIDNLEAMRNNHNMQQPIFLDKFLNEQIKLFNFIYNYNNVNSIMNIIEHKYFQLTLYC